MAVCDRCNCRTFTESMSYFNTDLICKECERREREHPAFEKARAAETKAVALGDWNFKGIGCPPELYSRKK